MSTPPPPPPGPPQGPPPPVGPPPSGMPGPGAGAYPAQPMQNGMGTAALIMGILQFFCLGVIGSILAIVFGKIGMDKADQGLADNRGVAKAGFVLGIIGVVLFALGLIILLIAGATGNLNSTYEYRVN